MNSRRTSSPAGVILSLLLLVLAAGVFWKLRQPATEEEVSAVPTEKPAGNLAAGQGVADRGLLVLNGLWRFLPAKAAGDFGPASTADKDWGLIQVPGDWRPPYNWPRDGLMPGVRDKGPVAFDGTLERGVFARQLAIPKEWAGQRVLLDFRRLSTDARLKIDGRDAGNLAFPGGEIDITALVQAGSQHELRVHVHADGGGESRVMLEGTMGDGQVAAQKTMIPHRGIVDDVFLLSRSSGTTITDVAVRTFARDRKFEFEVAFAGPKPQREFAVKLAFADDRGTPAKEFAATVRSEDLRELPGGRWLWCHAAEWPEAVLWTPERPQLYQMTVTAGDLTADVIRPWDVFTRRQGLREFGIDGRRFMLNGSPVRLRPTTAPEKYQGKPNVDFKWGEGSYHSRQTMRAALLGLKRIGFNTVEQWPSGPLNRDRVVFHDHFHELCDEVGMMVIAELPNMATMARDGSWNVPAKRRAWEQATASWIGRQRHHASIISWIHSPNFFGQNSLTQGPAGLGNRGAMDIDNIHYQKFAAMGHEANRFIKSIDPTRPVTTHHGATVGDFLAVNTYLNHTPQQELEDWWADYAANANMPYLAIEYEFPISYSFQGARWLARNGPNGERFFTEWLAARSGTDAYAAEPEFIRNAQREHWKGDPKAWTNMHVFIHQWDLWNTSPAYRTMMTENVKRQTLAQRTWGIDGGVIPWEFSHPFTHGDDDSRRIDFGPFVPGTRGLYLRSAPLTALDGAPPDGSGDFNGFAAALQPWLRPSLAWIAGGPDRFTRKDARFRTGERIEKQIALVNDHQQAMPYRFQIRWETGNGISGETTLQDELAAGEIKFLPLALDAPQVTERTKGTITLEGSIGGDQHRDTFTFSTWPKPAIPTIAKPRLFDPSGKTAGVLEALGVEFSVWNPDDAAISTGQLLILGENSLRDRPDLLARLPAMAREGARILVSRQAPEWLRDGPEFRVAHIVSREVFPVDSRHPLLEGLEVADLRDWRGESSLVEKNPVYPTPDRLHDQSGEEPMHYRRCGTLGAVTSAPIEKPHLSGMRPLLQTGFDLAYTPLMELEIGGGRIIWSTLDLEDNVPLDPAATRLATNLLAWLDRPATAPARPTFFAGSPVWEQRLRELGLAFSPLSATSIPDGALVLWDPGLAPTPALDGFVRSGGHAVVLPFAGTRPADAVPPFGVTLRQEMQFTGARSVPGWPVTAGLSLSDLRYRTDFPTLLADGGCETAADGLLGQKPHGKGTVLYLMIDPWGLDVAKVPALRTTRWRLTRAFNQILSNAGAKFHTDAMAFDSTKRNRLWLRDAWRAALTSRIEATGAELADPGMSGTATAAVQEAFDDRAWRSMELPAPYHHPGWWEYFGGEWRNADGEAVFRRKIWIPTAWAGKDLTLSLGRIADNDHTFFNGVETGNTKGRDKPRTYTIPGRLVRAGKNTLAVRVFNTRHRGGIVGNPGSEWPGENSLVIDDALWLAPAGTPPGRFLGLYHPDYRNDSGWGDDPYRYWKW